MTSPYDGREVGRVPVGTTDHLDTAIAAAVARRDGEPLPAWKRADILDKAAVRAGRTGRGVRPAHRRRGGQARSRRRGSRSPGRATRSGSAPRWLAPSPARPSRWTPPTAGQHKLGIVLRVPIGVVGAISPFNFPVNLVVHKLGPAIAAGCPVVLKPASATPLSALALAQMLVEECGLPDGWLNVVTCKGSVANHMVEHPDVAMITFTGSPPVGWGIRQQVPHKKVEPRARQQRPGDHRAVGRLGGRRRQDHRRRHLLRRPVLHLGAAGLRAQLHRRGLPRPTRPGLRSAEGRRPDGRRHRRQRPHRQG